MTNRRMTAATKTIQASVTAALASLAVSALAATEWSIDSQEDWAAHTAESSNLEFEDGFAKPKAGESLFTSKIKSFEKKTELQSITFEQWPNWQNWKRIPNVGPSNLGDAPIFLSLGPGNYWMFGRYSKPKGDNPKSGEQVKLEGFDMPLIATADPRVFDAPGAKVEDMGGYHAWQSCDMQNWVRHGNVTEGFARWATTAEYKDGKLYIYYDFPNDQDPHLYIDDDMTDGKPGRNVGLAFKDPSDGSDCGVIRDLDGRFHMIYEDWSPIRADKHAWDSPLAGHAVSDDGIGDFKILEPAVDERTTPTGEFRQYKHPHWSREDPKNFPSNVATYEVHEPEQNAFGDWAPISVGGQYYLFCDFDPAHGNMGVGWFTSESLEEQFRLCGKIGKGHPDPDIGFAEGEFYLITQMEKDFVSPGPWVEKVEARIGVDSSDDGEIDTWTEWSEVKETYAHIDGFAKQIAKTPASIDLSSLPACYGFQFEFRTTATTDNGALPVMDRVTVVF